MLEFRTLIEDDVILHILLVRPHHKPSPCEVWRQSDE